MAHDGFSLDDKRVPVAENDIPDVVECWRRRFDADASTPLSTSFEAARAKRISDLRRELAPLKEERLKLQAEVNRLQFESVLTTETQSHGEEQKKKSPRLRDSVVQALSDTQARLAELQVKIENPQSELDRLTRQFWVTKEQVCKGGAALRPNYDLSASRYRQVDADAVYHEKPSVTLERLARLESVMLDEIKELGKLVNGK
jgi:type I restriction enzyme M protein